MSGAYIWRCNITGAWGVNLPGMPPTSAGWNKHGHREAALICIRHAWEMFAKKEGRSVAEVCTVEGLLT